MKRNIIRRARGPVSAIVMAVALAACDAHIDVPDSAIRPGHVLCPAAKLPAVGLPHQPEDGQARRLRRGPDVLRHLHGVGVGGVYAVYLWDIAPKAFADSLGVKQGTSADITAYDGNTNTFALYGTQETTSPMAEAVFDLWKYGQSAYVPSVAQMRLLYAARAAVNPVIEKCGGHPLSQEADCWYWTSTEVEGQETAKAWLYSMGSGTMQETPKIQAHRVRPIITINN